ncbi:MAG TPA: type II toxin-antitoxin system VapC family toxin [Stellaceae bacterium]|nr:type II toxin-antitoxin system VapC family toxin [Stellaceae bacterium]
MTDLVLDASLALTWCFEDEATPGTRRVLERLAAEAASVPSIWHLEVANVLAIAERRRRITPAESAEFIGRLESLAILVDEQTSARAFARTLDLAREEHLTAYDAAYLELAMRLGVPLATKDDALRNAAKRLGVAVLAGEQ